MPEMATNIHAERRLEILYDTFLRSEYLQKIFPPKLKKKTFCAITLLSLYIFRELKTEQAYRFPI